ncbi:MAG: multicopper oxidase family protein [Chloroflexi bacterium]|nr:multicopper oxidase family protein [Chloroflexota bacterium]
MTSNEQHSVPSRLALRVGRDARRNHRSRFSTPTFAGVRMYSAALFTLAAGLIHLSVAPAHLREYVPFGVFFLIVGSAQIVLSVELAWQPTRRLALLVAFGSASLIALWIVSRTVGLPLGPTPGQAENVGLTDVLCNLLEVLSLPALLALVGWPARRKLRRIWLVAAGTLPSALVALAVTLVAVSAAMSDMPEAVNAAPAVAGEPSTSVTSLVATPGDEPVKDFTLTAEATVIDGQTMWTFNGSVPGPELRVNQGDRVRVKLVNHLPESTTIHWHGVAVPNSQDGVAGATQDAVPSGGEYSYEFIAYESGTFWYHSHQQTGEQLPRGLFGALVVVPHSGLAEQHDLTLLLHGSAGHVLINGTGETVHVQAVPGETIRLRLINAVDPGMDGGPEAPVLVGAPFQIVSLDGRDLNAPEVLGPTRIPLGMGQRADLVFSMPLSGGVRLIDTELRGATSPVQTLLFGNTETHLASVAIGDAAAPSLDVDRLPLFDPLHYGAPASDLLATVAPDETLTLALGEHPGIRDGRPQLIHTINGAASPDVPPLVVHEGQVIRLHIVNQTAEYHPMHLHGHVLTLLAVDGRSLDGSPVHQDSILVGPNQTVDAAFVADNPGVWMFHCHVLLHAEMGMTTSVNYVGYSTPFEMGTRSGNMPE